MYSSLHPPSHPAVTELYAVSKVLSFPVGTYSVYWFLSFSNTEHSFLCFSSCFHALFMRFIHVLHVAIVYSFSMQYSVLFYYYNTTYLSVQLLVDIWALLSLWLLRIGLLSTFLNTCFVECLYVR